jgi:3',5'-cyclic AMP phosphodiesterase CpdA
MKSILLFCLAAVMAGCSSKPQELPRFVVVSDTHFGSEHGDGATVKVTRSLKNLLSKEPLADAVFVVGDLTERGKPEEYDQLLSVFSDTACVPKGVAVYFMGGLFHDAVTSGNYDIYRAKVPQPLNQYVEIKGYPFITLTEGGHDAGAEVNVEARRFLSEKMADAALHYPGKPIFVFVHIPPLNTCYGSTERDSWGNDVFLSVLNRYPQAIVFSGHSHFPLGDPRSIHQGTFTTVNDGSLKYAEVEHGVVNIGYKPENYINVTEGVIVDVAENGDVEIERWDTRRNEEIRPKWIVRAPHDGSRFTYKNRDGLPAPLFPSGAKPGVSHLAGDSLVVTFPQATDNEVVHHYLVEITEKERVIASFSKFSQFYLNSDMPEELSVGFSGLPAGKERAVRVTAIDSYDNPSPPITARIDDRL